VTFDTDSDGICDQDEANTDPNDADSDDDGVNDGDEKKLVCSERFGGSCLV
jgi:hypothetical protein